MLESGGNFAALARINHEEGLDEILGSVGHIGPRILRELDFAFLNEKILLQAIGVVKWPLATQPIRRDRDDRLHLKLRETRVQ